MNTQLSAAVVERAHRHVVVLIVDDETAVRRAVGRVLCRFGFHVLEAESGEAALEQLQRHPSISVVLLDQSMPTGTGASYADRLRAARPGVRLIFHTAQPVGSDDRALVDDVIHKPADILAMVELIDRWSPQAGALEHASAP